MASRDTGNNAAGKQQQQHLSTSKRYRGVRMRKWGSWVAEVRFPNSRQRLWLGSYRTPEQAARAFDAAVYCLRGTGARCNFPGQLPDITPTHKLSPEEIRAAAMRFARDVPTRPGEAQEGGMETSTETAVPNKGNSATVTGLLSADKPIPAEKRIGAVQLANEGEKTAEEVDQGEGSSGTMVKPPEASKELPWPWNAEDEDTWPAFSYDDDIYESSPLWNFRSAD
ncbi:unnamed protein product [Musa acuminata subsp. burmannicoides]|uniref:(wild Malaysian banana) hypothetical protein n=1 Tax=Musa acuminata subsp. malaccensis TaxID=214687 RepID=A0A804I0V7_MUSAM|nr:PREDICTED: ethylene-responsive transcription factor ERF018-like [Musa acuminata subsp. malaccensis]CAG1861532.1 unnamed protein product [Musa acuminata subsp. malaccensis]